jgi:hemoglobin-like flavoprotein
MTAFDLASLWVGLVVGVPAYYLAGSLVDLGMSAAQGVATVALANLVVLATLVLVRKSLSNFDAIVPTLRALGARHVGYGTQAAHFDVAGPLLIESMAAVAGDAWRPAYTAAWARAWGALVAEMLAGAEEAGAQDDLLAA